MFVNIPGMFVNIPRNVWRDCPERLATFPRIFEAIPWNTWQHSSERLVAFPLFLAFPAFRSPFLHSSFYTQPVRTLILKEIKNIRHFLLLKAHPLPQSHKHFSVMGNNNSPRQCSRGNLGISLDNLDKWAYLKRVMVVNFLIYKK